MSPASVASSPVGMSAASVSSSSMSHVCPVSHARSVASWAGMVSHHMRSPEPGAVVSPSLCLDVPLIDTGVLAIISANRLLPDAGVDAVAGMFVDEVAVNGLQLLRGNTPHPTTPTDTAVATTVTQAESPVGITVAIAICTVTGRSVARSAVALAIALVGISVAVAICSVTG